MSNHPNRKRKPSDPEHLDVRSWQWEVPYWATKDRKSASPMPNAGMYHRNPMPGVNCGSRYEFYAAGWATRMIALRDELSERLGREVRVMCAVGQGVAESGLGDWGPHYMCAAQAADGRWLPIGWDVVETVYYLDEYPPKQGRLLTDAELDERAAYEARPIYPVIKHDGWNVGGAKTEEAALRILQRWDLDATRAVLVGPEGEQVWRSDASLAASGRNV